MPDLSFDIQSPSGLLRKFRYDIVRLRKARYTEDLRFAAFDCAISGWHLVDWLLGSVDDAHHVTLCGVVRKQRQGISKGFIERNASRLPGLSHCQQIANTGKHLILSTETDPALSTKTSVKFEPPMDFSEPEIRKSNMYPIAYIRLGATEIDAVTFFMDLERAWRCVLVEEGHLSPELRNTEIDFS